MVRPRRPLPRETSAQTADFEDLRSTIARALDVTPVAGPALRKAVWNYVGAERDAGTAPGRVVLALTGMVEDAPIDAGMAHQALMRRVILWGVEAYFGHLGGDVLDHDERMPERLR